jgi:hypothetical protein
MSSAPLIDISSQSQDEGLGELGVSSAPLIDISCESQDEGIDEVGIFNRAFTGTLPMTSTPKRVQLKKHNKRQRVSDENSLCVSTVPSLLPGIAPSFVESPRRTVKQHQQLQGCPWMVDPARLEHLWNKDNATSFDSQEKHDAFESQRRRVNKDRDMHLTSTFIVGKGIRLLIGLWKIDIEGDMMEKVALVITAGKNEIKFSANRFLNYMVPLLNANLLSTCKESHYTQLRKHIKAEFYKDEISTWIVLRSYVDGYVMEKIYISSNTWIEIQRLVPVLCQCRDNYFNTILQGHYASSIKENE